MLRTDEFDFELPPELIAQTPPAHRSDSRLLIVNRTGLQDSHFTTFPDWLDPGDVLVFNDTRVIKARLFGHKPSGGRVECLVERVLPGAQALVHLRSSHAPRPNTTVLFQDGWSLLVLGREADLFRVRLLAPGEDGVTALHISHGSQPFPDLLAWLERYGQLPLPPYIAHAPTAQDEQRYQTVYASKDGAVAAPTAGLHFDSSMLERIRARGVDIATVTLHVGAGTFQPVRAEYVQQHVMHGEWYDIPLSTVQAIARAQARGGRVIAVGTTSLRALESSAAQTGELQAGSGETHLFITPGYQFRVVQRLFTNFHLPRSTLLMLVSAFAGQKRVREAYQHAIDQGYRFFSYGDAVLMDLMPEIQAPAAEE